MKALALNRARRFDALSNRRRRLTRNKRRDLVARQRRHLNLQIDAIKEWYRDLPKITGDLHRRANAFAPRVVEVAAGTGVQRAGEREARREGDGARRARDRDGALF